jgi:hypothetical protein
MAMYSLGLDPLGEDRSKTACWVSTDRPIFLQSEIRNW